MIKKIAVMGAAMIAVTYGSIAAAQQGEAPSAIQETYRAWQVVCQPDSSGKGKLCAMSQERSDSKSGQRVMAAELRPSQDGLQATFIMPFGLALQAGVALQVDDNPPTPAIPFSTCVPAGCILPVNFDDKVVGVLRKASTLTMKIKTVAGEDMALTFSLDGFTAASQRLVELSK